MRKLTPKEKEVMALLWAHGPMFIREMLAFYDEPKPHYNTVATIVKLLIEKGSSPTARSGTRTGTAPRSANGNTRARHSGSSWPSSTKTPTRTWYPSSSRRRKSGWTT